jgi:hypothetical protein
LALIGSAVQLRTYWGEGCPGSGYHNAMGRVLEQIPETDRETRDALGRRWFGQEIQAGDWPTHCAYCGERAPETANRQVFPSLVYRAPDGETIYGRAFQRGDLYPSPCWRTQAVGACEWDNCNGTHWTLILPNGHSWDMSSRASNCTMPQDRQHRCWVLHGDPPHSADKAGHTCAAGAGSIQSGDFHGFYRDGEIA